MSRRGKGQQGSAAVEFALSFVLLFSVLAGVFQFGYAYYIYNTLETAVRGASRYASLRVYDSATATPSAGYLSAVRNMVVYGNPSGSGQVVAPGLTPENVSITVVMERKIPVQITVAISSYTVNAAIRSFTLVNKPMVTFPFMGRFAP